MLEWRAVGLVYNASCCFVGRKKVWLFSPIYCRIKPSTLKVDIVKRRGVLWLSASVFVRGGGLLTTERAEPGVCVRDWFVQFGEAVGVRHLG